MGLSVTNISALKTIAADDKRLRFVESEKAWFWSDPGASETSDDVQIITPNAGTGRWYKLYAREVTPSDWTWAHVTSAPSTVYANNKSGFVCNASSNNPITVVLPDTPLFGQTVRIRKVDATDWNRRVIIDRNGKKIEGATTDIAFAGKGTDAELLYVNDTVGWSVASNLGYSMISNPTIVTLTRVSNGDANGLFNYIATNKLTNNWTNPASGSNNFVGIYWWGAGYGRGLSTQQSGVVDRSPGQVYANGLYGHRLVLKINGNTSRLFRLTTLNVQNDGYPNSWRGFKIYGTTMGNGVLSDAGVLNGADWELIATFSGDSSMAISANAWGVYQVNAIKFYNTFYIEHFEPLTGEPNSEYYRVGEVEMYGDLIW